MIDIKTYKYTSDRNRVDKTDLLAATGDYTGVLNASFDILHPVVRFRVDTPVNFNYAQIPALGDRFYFVDTIKQDGNVCIVSFSVDVLHTYRNMIKKLSGTLTQGEDTDKFVSSRDIVYDTRTINKFLWFPNSDVLNGDGTITMVTLKGDK